MNTSLPGLVDSCSHAAVTDKKAKTYEHVWPKALPELNVRCKAHCHKFDCYASSDHNKCAALSFKKHLRCHSEDKYMRCSFEQ